MNPITEVQQDLLARMETLKGVHGNAAIKPAQVFTEASQSADFAGAFKQVIQAVDAQQHQSSAAMEAVDSGQSDDLVGAMIESQKASVAFSALMQVRNKLTTAFDEVMRTPL